MHQLVTKKGSVLLMHGVTIKLLFIWLDRATRGEMVIFIISLKNLIFPFLVTLLCLSTATFHFYSLFLHAFTLHDFRMP